MTLLMVNDEVLTVETMKAEIQWYRYGIDQVWTAYGAQEARECICGQSVDIILCDIEMPEENGIDFVRWIREEHKEIECIFLTCHASFEYAKEAIGLGCRDYILMPARYEEIGAAVQKVADRITEERRARQYQEYGRQVVKAKLENAMEDYGQKKSAGELAEAAADYIIQNLGSFSLSVNEVADTLSLHPVYLSRVFKKEKQISIGQFIIAERMKLAGELLRTQHLSANGVAEQVGYASYTNFNLMFRKYYGCSPSQYGAGEV